MSNLETVQRIYEAFGRQDGPAILEPIAEDVVWEYGNVENGVPWLTPGRGRNHVAAFLGTVARELEFKSFAISEMVGSAHVIIALASLEAIVKSTGKRIVEENEPHIWHFDARGKVVRFRHAADTYAHVLALRA